METVAIFKWSRDPQDARISVNGGFTWGEARMQSSDDDSAVMEAARAISSEEEITALTVGDGDRAWAAARGAARTLTIEDAVSAADGSAMASVLAAAIRRIGVVDAVMIGDSDWDRAVVVALAGCLGLPAYAGVTSVEASGGFLSITCKTGGELRTIEVGTPVFLAVKGLSSEKSVPGMRQVLSARKKPQEVIVVGDLEGVWDSRAVEDGIALPDADTVTMIDGSDPGQASAELLSDLRSEGLL